MSILRTTTLLNLTALVRATAEKGILDDYLVGVQGLTAGIPSTADMVAIRDLTLTGTDPNFFILKSFKLIVDEVEETASQYTSDGVVVNFANIYAILFVLSAANNNNIPVVSITNSGESNNLMVLSLNGVGSLGVQVITNEDGWLVNAPDEYFTLTELLGDVDSCTVRVIAIGKSA